MALTFDQANAQLANVTTPEQLRALTAQIDVAGSGIAAGYAAEPEWRIAA